MGDESPQEQVRMEQERVALAKRFAPALSDDDLAEHLQKVSVGEECLDIVHRIAIREAARRLRDRPEQEDDDGE